MAVPLVSNGRFDACRKIVDGVKVTAASFLEQSLFYGCNIVVSLFFGGGGFWWLASIDEWGIFRQTFAVAAKKCEKVDQSNCDNRSIKIPSSRHLHFNGQINESADGGKRGKNRKASDATTTEK